MAVKGLQTLWATAQGGSKPEKMQSFMVIFLGYWTRCRINVNLFH